MHVMKGYPCRKSVDMHFIANILEIEIKLAIVL